MDLMARLPTAASLIYRNTFHHGKPGAAYNSSLDYSANFARMLGFTAPQFDEVMRLYLTIHSDHEGGNVSAHTTRLVGSALSDPYLSFSAAMCGLAGPLHGLANQEVLGWVLDLQEKFKKEGKSVDENTIREFAWETLNSACREEETPRRAHNPNPPFLLFRRQGHPRLRTRSPAQD